MRGKVFWRKLKGDFASGSVAFCDSSGIIPIGRFKTPSEIMKGIFLVSGVVGAYLALQMWILPGMGVQT